MLPFELGNPGFLGNIFQLAPGFVALRLETEGVTLIVARGGEVVWLRGVVWQGRICGWRRGRISLDEPEKTKGIVRNRKKSRENRKRS
jgi:hypothetical protein